ncbi:U-box domain-containing protein 4 [Hibiscus syriacus]|uniref:RING-type E3 ubiquitin transferase n=1 Tax=Hibiscus syriacus TaxID=106335 RepID=A0A6A3AQY2_HIBSY|nr:U-box domain-containing protein 4 [Hibiscus syriacus]
MSLCRRTIRNSSLDIFHIKSSNQHLPYELSSSYLEKIKHVGDEQTSSVIEEAIKEILIEAVALEKLKENADQADKTAEVEYIDKLIALVTRMHHRIILIKQSQTSSPVLIPSNFICPLSLELMTEPVIVASRKTYEHAFIKKWIDLGLTMCPKTRQKLTHTNLIPNYTVKALIANWCESNNVKLPDPIKFMSLNAPYTRCESEVKKLVEDLKSTSIDTQREATAQLSNKTAIANANAIFPLIHVLEIGSPVAKENTAATLFSLSAIEDNKVKIGRSGAIRPLVDLLGNGTPRGKKDAVTALFNLSIFHENKARIVQAGAVRYLVDLMLPTAGMVDKAVFVLAKLATIPEGRTAIEKHCGIPILVEVVEMGSARGKENAAGALLHLCICSPRLSMISFERKHTVTSVGVVEDQLLRENFALRIYKEKEVLKLKKTRLPLSLAFWSSIISKSRSEGLVQSGLCPLVDLLGNGTPRGKKDAATTLFNLSIFHENKAQIVHDAAVRYLVDLMDPAAGMVDKVSSLYDLYI